MATEVEAARERYIDDLDKIVQLYDRVNTKLSALETAFTSADCKLAEVYGTLEERLTKAKVASTASSATSILGVALLFTPFAPLGVGLTVAGAAGSVTTSLVQTLVFEGGASQAFADAINGYTSSSLALQDHLDNIELTKLALADSLVKFLAALENPGVSPSIPKGAKGGRLNVPKPGPGPNKFSTTVIEGLVNGAAAAKPWMNVGAKTATNFGELLGKNGGKLLVNTLPKLAKVMPVASVFIDVASIVSTWTSTNGTLQQADKLRKDLQATMALFRQAVSQLTVAMESLIGSPALQATLGKLIRLRAAVPRRPDGPPSGIEPNQACKMLGLMKQTVDIPLLLFASLQSGSDDNEDGTENDRYLTEFVPKADVLQLGQMAISAPVVDSVYDKYPDFRSRPDTDQQLGDEHEEKPYESMMTTKIQAFRDECTFTPFGNEDVYNVAGSQVDKPPSGTWIDFWRWFHKNANNGKCISPKCYIKYPNWHNHIMVGGHMEKKSTGSRKYWYILPICGEHNAPGGKYNRSSGNWMTTYADAYAVRIDPLF